MAASASCFHQPFTPDEIENAVHAQNIRQILADPTPEEKSNSTPTFVRASTIAQRFLVEEYHDLVFQASSALASDARAVLLARSYTNRHDAQPGNGPWAYGAAYNAVTRWCLANRKQFNEDRPLHGKRFQANFITQDQIAEDILCYIDEIHDCLDDLFDDSIFKYDSDGDEALDEVGNYNDELNEDGKRGRA